MKKITLFVFAILISAQLFAQNEQYTQAMKNAITQLETSESIEEFKATAATFERIANVAKTEWLPTYYLGYANLILCWKSMQEEDYKAYDLHIAAVEKALETAQGLAGAHSELYVLEAYMYQAKITRKPMVNGMRYSSSVDTAIKKAKELDPNNPRAYYVMANQIYNMPAFIGGGKEKAIPEYELAAEKFASFKAESDLHPNWGAGGNEQMLNRAKS